MCLIVSSRHIEYDVPIADEKNKVMFYFKKNHANKFYKEERMKEIS